MESQVVLRGRDRQLEVLDELLDRARSGQGGALALLTEPGMGRSALLEWTVRRADPDFRILGIRGIRPESGLAFAGLNRLLAPVTDRIGRLPRPQAAALASLREEAGEEEDACTLYGAVHRLLAEVARDRPVLCWADDVHWLDRPSLEALAFTARRLGSAPILMLFAAHNEHVTTPERDRLAEIPRLPLPPLDAAASRQILADQVTDGLPEDLCAGLVELSAGNPLGLVELGAALTPGQLSGEEPPPESLPPYSRLRAIYRRRFFRLSTDARLLVLLAVADDALDADILARAAAAAGLDLGELEPARARGLIRVDGNHVDVPNPLIRTALYADAPLAERHAVHNLLAQVLDQDHHRLRRVWHQVALAGEPSTHLGGELRAAAAVARESGHYADSARAWRRAAALTPDPAGRAHDLLAAATDSWLAGRPREARALVRQVLAGADSEELRGRADLLRGEIELRDGVPSTARRILLEAADGLLRADRGLAVTALAYAGEASCLAGDLAGYLTIAERAAALREPDEHPDLELLFEHFEGTAASFQGRHTDSSEPLHRLVKLAETTENCAATIWGSMAAIIAGDDPLGHELAGRAVNRARGPDVASRPWALHYLAISALWLGRYPAAVADSLEGLRLARAAGQENCAVDHLAMLALLAALQGDRESALLRLESVTEVVTRRGLARPEAIMSWAIACLELLEDRPADAAARLRLMTGTGHVHPVVRVMAAPHYVEAALRCDQRESAVQACRVFDQWATSTQSSSRLALSRRCQALLAGSGAEAERHFTEALRLHHSGGSAFELARTELLFGLWLRRARRPRTARYHLRNALQIFQHYDADPWTERARTELRAAGETVERAASTSGVDLTPQQQQIARMAAEGATNREIAAQLVLSPRTVDHHLRNIFTRLEIRSRVELSRFFR
ncbi:AAA family ATPase [Actinomadura scrupuli]|uniref:AAA family ATPase n=1 Tax=Actinomadura scrupuli TaxID=559629 RepID=UPI003D984454